MAARGVSVYDAGDVHLDRGCQVDRGSHIKI
jgi:hypothetical protein